MNSIKSFFYDFFYSIPTLGVMDIVDILVVGCERSLPQPL